MARKIEIPYDILYEKYIIELKSIKVISNELNLSSSTIHKNLKKYKLNRSCSEAQKLKCENLGQYNEFKLDDNQLRDLYLNRKLTSYQIANILGCSQYKVWKTLKEKKINRSVSDVMKGKTPWNKGKIGFFKHSDNAKLKIRMTTLDRIKKSKLNGGQLYPAYNKESISIIEDFGRENGYSFQHAENGGEYFIEELGYWVDGYDIENNVVLEFDEDHHKYQKEKDLKRQKEIINHLKCKFIRA
jgi:DNA-binding CsgD family transcriptional regulator